MRRSELLKVSVYCPHHKRAVAATRNGAIDRLVACDENESCREPAGAAGTEHERPFPRGCPVYPQLAK